LRFKDNEYFSRDLWWPPTNRSQLVREGKKRSSKHTNRFSSANANTNFEIIYELAYNDDDESTKMQQIIFYKCNSNIENSQLVVAIARPFEIFFFEEFFNKQVANSRIVLCYATTYMLKNKIHHSWSRLVSIFAWENILNGNWH
jgi:hypothetical protein